ncbi:MAG: hypothetical protein WBV82_13855 [Myxococcaceae bacterium]
MNRGILAAAGIAVLVTAGCTTRAAWQYDESHRIDEAMRCEPFHPNMSGARGIAVYSAPPMAAPWREGEGYQLRREESGRKARFGKVKPRPPRAPRENRADAAQR